MKGLRSLLKSNAERHSQSAKPGRIFWSHSGQSVIEVALLTPVLLSLLIGVIELGRYAYFGILVGNAAHAGAMYGAQTLPQSIDGNGQCVAASNDFNGAVTTCSGSYPTYSSSGSNGTLNITSSTTCGCDSGGAIATATCSAGASPTAGTCPAGSYWTVMVSVTATATFNSLFHYLPSSLNSLTVSRTSQMRVALY
jgi:Flp pilus assembly protein TadG